MLTSMVDEITPGLLFNRPEQRRNKPGRHSLKVFPQTFLRVTIEIFTSRKQNEKSNSSTQTFKLGHI
jgi:hypothetical protein